MILDNKGKNAKKKPFKWTRELIKLALNDGWTQSEIAEKCRTQQSIVSAWNRGSCRLSSTLVILNGNPKRHEHLTAQIRQLPRGLCTFTS